MRFARPDQWLGEWDPVGVDEAALEVTRRYLAAYGPANREALARWFGMPSPALAGRWLKGLGDEAAAVEVDGEELVMLAADVEEAATAEPTGSVRLLPAFDHYVVAAPRDRDAVACRRSARPRLPAAGLAVAGAPGRRPDGGRMVGTSARATGWSWSSSRSGGCRRAVRAGAEAEAAALAGFLGGELQVAASLPRLHA